MRRFCSLRAHLCKRTMGINFFLASHPGSIAWLNSHRRGSLAQTFAFPLTTLRPNGMITAGARRRAGQALSGSVMTDDAEVDSWLSYAETAGEFDQQLRLASRAAFERDLARAAAMAPRSLSAFMLDIDHFKKVNDTHGHGRGDEVLAQVAATMRQVVGRRGRVYRWGGEEFFALLPGFVEGEAAAVAERLREAVESMDFAHGAPKRVTASLGVAEITADEDDKAFCKRVDQALYRAKNGGRNLVVAAAGNYGTRSEPRPRVVVLIIDADAFIRDIIVNFLSAERGFDDLLRAANVTDGLNLVARAPAVVAFVSLEIDGRQSSGGREIIRALRAKSPKARIYGTTSYEDPKSLADAVVAGADGVILKPFTVETIIALAAAARDGAPPPPVNPLRRGPE